MRRFTPLFAEAARFARHSPGDRWFVDETYVNVSGAGSSSTGPLISMGGRSSTCSSQLVGMAKRPPLHPPRHDHVEGDTERDRD
jgi:hypothetical protein